MTLQSLAERELNKSSLGFKVENDHLCDDEKQRQKELDRQGLMEQPPSHENPRDGHNEIE